jgi:hypothetical protein
MLSSRSRGLTIALVAGALTLMGASGATAKAPDRPQKGIAPGCLAVVEAAPPGLHAPPQECQEGPIS